MGHRTTNRTVSVLGAVIFLLASCAYPPAGQRWVRGAASEEAIQREVDSCNAAAIFLFPLVWPKYCMRKNGFRLQPEVASQ